MYYSIPSESADPSSHQKNLELFQLLELARQRMDHLLEIPAADPEELKEWERIADKAREQLILANQGLLASMAKRYGHYGLAFDDLVAEGQFGLMTAIDKFEWQRGCRFSTHAFLWIKQSITRAVSKYSRTIRLPETKLTEIRRLKKAMERFREESGSEPTAEDIAWELDLPEERVRTLMSVELQTLSIHSRIDGQEGAALIDYVADPSAVHPGEVMDRSLRYQWLRESQRSLTPRELEVLQLRLGMEGSEAQSLNVIGTRLGLSRERVRQIQSTAIEKVRRYLDLQEKWKMNGSSESTVSAVEKVEAKPNSTCPVPNRARPANRLKNGGLVIRSVQKNPNHHLWNNNGTWFCKFRVHDAQGGTRSINKSLKTRLVEEARVRRDEMMADSSSRLRDAVA